MQAPGTTPRQTDTIHCWLHDIPSGSRTLEVWVRTIALAAMQPLILLSQPQVFHTKKSQPSDPLQYHVDDSTFSYSWSTTRIFARLHEMAVVNGYVHLPDPELHKIIPNSLYLTFNAPQVDEYHRGIFLTYPPYLCVPAPLFSGRLFHASYITKPTRQWVLEHRFVKDLSSSKSLVLLYRIASYEEADMARINTLVQEVLSTVPLGREARSKQLGEVNGNAALGGYDCVIWTGDALNALIKAGLVRNCSGRTVNEIMAEARALAGPPDARTMVGVDVGGVRVIN